jgi:outer membrane protein OmpA-like peptidoglycan-associated protein
MKGKYTFLALVLSLTSVVPVEGDFEDKGYSARATGMNNAFVAVADDGYALYYNSAGLSLLNDIEVGTTYGRLFAGLRDSLQQAIFVVSYPLKNIGTIGFGYTGFSVVDASNNALYNEDIAAISVGKNMSEIFKLPIHVGINLKLLSKTYGRDEYSQYYTVLEKYGYRKNSLTADVGFIYAITEENIVGVSIHNVTQPNTGVYYTNILPLTFYGGIARKIKTLTLGLSISYQHQVLTSANFGVEKWFLHKMYKTLAIRGGLGIGTNEYKVLTLGVGYYPRISRMWGIGIDYAFVYPFSGIKNVTTHWVSVKVAYSPILRVEERRMWFINIDAVPQYISPDGDGNKDYLTFVSSSTLKEAISWKIIITSEDGAVVKTFSGEGLLPERITWDGKDDKQRLLPTGVYNYVLKAKNMEGEEKQTLLQKLYIDLVAPKIELSSNIDTFTPDGDGIDDIVTIKPKASDNVGISDWLLKIISSDNKLTKTFQGKGVPPESIVWDGKDEKGKLAPPDKYTCRFIVYDLAGNKSVSSINIELKISGKVEIREVEKKVVRELPAGMEVKKIPGGMKIIISANVLFEPQSYQLLPSAYEIFDEVVKILSAYPDSKIRIEGHTDNVGNPSDNQLLSELRARSVYNILVKKKVSPARLMCMGYGDKKPIASNLTPEGRAKNRRIEIIVLKTE